MKLLKMISMGILVFGAQAASADVRDTVLECNFDGKIITLEAQPTCGNFLRTQGELGDGITVSARIRPGYGMMFHDVQLRSYETTIAQVTLWIKDQVGSSADDEFGKLSTLTLTANPGAHNIICSYHIGAALKAIGR